LTAAASGRHPGAGTHLERGNALYDQGRIGEAILAYRDAVRVTPDSAIAHHNLGVSLEARGLTQEGIAALREAIRLQPDYASAWSNLGNALQAVGTPDEAIACYGEALRVKPGYAAAHYNLGCVLRLRGRPSEAIEAFRAAVRLKPDFLDAHANLGATLNDQARLEEALEAYEHALRLKPDWGGPAAVSVHLSLCLAQWDGLGRRVAALRKAIASNTSLAEGIPPWSMLVSEASAAEQLHCARHWVAHKRFAKVADLSRTHRPREGASRRLRVGYLSSISTNILSPT
jgi:tetratricopeptide (TPR) repeat protein